MSERHVFAALPARAIGDARLSGTDLRLLAAIAGHDRFGKNGAGCYASQARLAALIGAHEKAVARSAGRLVDCGYVTVERNPTNGRLVIYRVVYTDDDAAAFRGDGRSFTQRRELKLAPNSAPPRDAIGNNAVTDAASATAEQEADSRPPIGNMAVTDQGRIGNKQNQKTPRKQLVARANIFPEGENKLGEALLGGKSSADPVLITDPPGAVERDHRSERPDGAGPRYVPTLNQWLWRSGEDASMSEIDAAIHARARASTARPSNALLATAACRNARAWGLG